MTIRAHLEQGQYAIRAAPRDVGADRILPYAVRFQKLGFPCSIETDSRRLADLIERIRDDNETNSVEVEPQDLCRIQILLANDETAAGGLTPKEPKVLSREHLLSIAADAENWVHCDMNRALAFGCLQEKTIGYEEFARYYYLDAAALSMIQHRYLAPIHAALIARDDCGILLCGDSGAGKSTLAYACARAGFTLICDDASYLIRGRADSYAIGDAEIIRLRPDSQRFFPELDEFPVHRRINGKIGREIPTKRLGIATARGVRISTVLFLERSELGPPRFHAMSEDAGELLARTICFGDSGVRRQQVECLQKLTKLPTLLFHYHDLESAVEFLWRWCE